ncbi:MAG: serine/threonine-protein kinase [Candidatus Pacebacteria bacterium]|nr:serine/threonine-protein kinase [Candidatus Paceibacterota bacterium]
MSKATTAISREDEGTENIADIIANTERGSGMTEAKLKLETETITAERAKGVLVFTNILDGISATISKITDRSNIFVIQYPDKHKEVLKTFVLDKGNAKAIEGARFEFELPRLLHTKTVHVAKPLRIEEQEEQNGILHIEILLEYGGISLRSMLKDDIAPYTFLAWIKQSLEAMKAIQELGICHSDIKPANMVYGEKNLRIIDFGCAIKMSSRHFLLSNSPCLVKSGTKCYLPPELHCGGAIESTVCNHGAIDVYCWGMTFYQLLTKKTCNDLQVECKSYKSGPDKYGEFLEQVSKISIPGDGGATLQKSLLPILEVALSYDPMDRPTFAALCNLTKMITIP